MIYTRARMDGFHLLGIALVAAALAIVGLIGAKVLRDTHTGSQSQDDQTSGSPTWEYDQKQQVWKVTSGQAPACKKPFRFDNSPVDLAKVAAIGLPGAYRGFSYKAHGGFRLSSDTNGYADVRMPMDAKLMAIGRYYEQIPGYGYELQYILDFENDCGIAFRFDHLYELAPVFQAYADRTPAPKKDDTRSIPRPPIRKLFKAGDLIATRVGFPNAGNYGFDFGAYDYRTRNSISKNPAWAAIHAQFSAQQFHGVCWLPLLPSPDAARAEAIATDRNNYNSNKPFNLTSDYCEFAPHTTLEFNDGQPTEG